MEGEGIMKSEISNAKVADILIQALPYIRKYNGRIVVVKYGGNAMESPVIQEQVMKDIVLMTAIGIKVVVVHGGGLDIADALKKMGIERDLSMEKELLIQKLWMLYKVFWQGK